MEFTAGRARAEDAGRRRTGGYDGTHHFQWNADPHGFDPWSRGRQPEKRGRAGDALAGRPGHLAPARPHPVPLDGQADRRQLFLEGPGIRRRAAWLCAGPGASAHQQGQPFHYAGADRRAGDGSAVPVPLCPALHLPAGGQHRAPHAGGGKPGQRPHALWHWLSPRLCGAL